MDNATRIWVPIEGWEGFYEVSSLGDVRSLSRVVLRRNGSPKSIQGRILVPGRDGGGYQVVHLTRPGELVHRHVHRLVAQAFIGAGEPGMHVCHNDGDRLNNRVENLRWDTPSSNSRDTVRHGSHRNSKKTHCGRGHLLAGANVAQRKTPTWRGCIACHRATAHVGRHPELDIQEVSDSYYAAIMERAG